MSRRLPLLSLTLLAALIPAAPGAARRHRNTCSQFCRQGGGVGEGTPERAMPLSPAPLCRVIGSSTIPYDDGFAYLTVRCRKRVPPGTAWIYPVRGRRVSGPPFGWADLPLRRAGLTLLAIPIASNARAALRRGPLAVEVTIRLQTKPITTLKRGGMRVLDT